MKYKKIWTAVFSVKSRCIQGRTTNKIKIHDKQHIFIEH